MNCASAQHTFPPPGPGAPLSAGRPRSRTLAAPVGHTAVRTYAYLDLVRGLAALTVLASHLRAFVFVDAERLPPLDLPERVFYFVTSLGGPAVVVFFVLSGFLISKNIVSDDRAGRWSWRAYAMKRLSRLWLVLLPALALGALWDRLGMALTHSSLYTGGLNAVNHSTPLASQSYGLGTLLGNALFLQTILVVPFGSNAPLWSLANEFWYYVLFPLVYFALRPRRSAARRIGAAVAALALCFWLPHGLTLYGLVWLLGYAVYAVEPLARRLPNAAHAALFVASVAVLAVVLVASKSSAATLFPVDFSAAAAFAVMMLPLTRFRSSRGVAAVAKLVAEPSYSLYVLHFPFLAFLTSIAFHNERFAPGPAAFAAFALVLAATLLYTFAVYWLFERNTGRVQAWLASRLRLRPAPVVLDPGHAWSR